MQSDDDSERYQEPKSSTLGPGGVLQHLGINLAIRNKILDTFPRHASP
jgi:hypothetical protein